MHEDSMLFESVRCIDFSQSWHLAQLVYWTLLVSGLIVIHALAILQLSKTPQVRWLRNLAVTALYCALALLVSLPLGTIAPIDMRGPLVYRYGEAILLIGIPFLALTVVGALIGRYLHWQKTDGAAAPIGTRYSLVVLLLGVGCLMLDIGVAFYLRGIHFEKHASLLAPFHQYAEWLFLHRRGLWCGSIGCALAFVNLRVNERAGFAYRRAAGLCARCGYQIPTPGGRCPECGTRSA